MENHGIPWNPLEICGIPSDSLEFHGGGASAGRARSVPVKTAEVGAVQRGRAGQREPAEIYKKHENL